MDADAHQHKKATDKLLSVQLYVRQLALLVSLSEINNVLLARLLPVLSFKGEVSLRGKEGGERGGRGVVVLIKSVTCDL